MCDKIDSAKSGGNFMRAIISLVQALLFIVSGFAVPDSNFKLWVDRAAMEISSTTDISFESMDADEYSVTAEDKAICRKWFNENVLSTENPAYNFTVGGKRFRNNLKNWEFSFSDESETGAVYRGGKTTYITVTHKKSDITATVEATIYEENASCDWTVYIKNNGNQKRHRLSFLQHILFTSVMSK